MNVDPCRQHLPGAVDEGLASVPARELPLERVDLKDTASHQHPVLQTLTRTRTLGPRWTRNLLQGLVVVLPAHRKLVVRNDWTAC